MLVGLDVGTSGLKGIAVDPEDGAVVASTLHDYPMTRPEPGWAEQDGADYERAALAALASLGQALGKRARDVVAIGLSGQMHTSMLLGEDGSLVRRAILWCDGRTTAACRTITDRLGTEGLAATVGNAALEGFTLPKLVWLAAHEPEVLEATRWVVMPKDLVAERLTGEIGTEVSDASGTLAFEPRQKRFSTAVLEAVGIDPGLFPEAGESCSVAGTLRDAIADASGLPRGIPVARGAADNAAGAVGLGVVRPGLGMASIGTSGVVLAPTASFEVDPELRLHSFCHAVPDRFYLMGVMLAAGEALKWYRDVLRGGAAGYDEITAEAASAPIGSGGVVFLPYLMGERTPHNDASARAAFVGITGRSTRADLSRAVLEGISLGLADSLKLMREVPNAPRVHELRLSGGGARSEMWRQLLADVLGMSVATTRCTEGPALGAAMLGAVAAGVFASVEDAADAIVTVAERRDPDDRAHAAYGPVHAAYRDLYGDLRARFADLGCIDRGEAR